LQGVYRHRHAGTRICPPCSTVNSGYRLFRRVLRGDQKGCYVPLTVLGELLRCATPEVLMLAEEGLPKGVVEAALTYLKLVEELDTAGQDEDDQIGSE
jgi:hypothetical protein